MTPTTVCSSSLNSSTRRTLRGLPTLMGTTDMGKRTELRRGKMAMLSIAPVAATESAPSGGSPGVLVGGRELLAMCSEGSTDLLYPHHNGRFPVRGSCV